MSYFVLELQTVGTQGAVIPTAYADKADALAAAYTLAGVAVKSSVDIHTILCVDSTGFDIIPPMVFDHRKSEEPETEE